MPSNGTVPDSVSQQTTPSLATPQNHSQSSSEDAYSTRPNGIYKTKTCRFYARGKCTAGDACKWSHLDVPNEIDGADPAFVPGGYKLVHRAYRSMRTSYYRSLDLSLTTLLVLSAPMRPISSDGRLFLRGRLQLHPRYSTNYYPFHSTGRQHYTVCTCPSTSTKHRTIFSAPCPKGAFHSSLSRHRVPQRRYCHSICFSLCRTFVSLRHCRRCPFRSHSTSGITTPSIASPLLWCQLELAYPRNPFETRRRYPADLCLVSHHIWS